MTKHYRQFFGLSTHEINLAQGFFTGQVPAFRVEDLASPRTTNRWCQPKSVTQFLDYVYDGGH